MTNGPAKETPPRIRLALHSRLNWGTSTSAPARKVSTMPAKAPTKESQSGIETWKALPTTTPSASSISATEKPTSTEIVLATRIVAARIAATATSLNPIPPCRRGLFETRGHQPDGGYREPHRGANRLSVAAP